MQTSGTGRKTDASCHLEKKTTSLVNRQGGFEGVPHGGQKHERGRTCCTHGGGFEIVCNLAQSGKNVEIAPTYKA